MNRRKWCEVGGQSPRPSGILFTVQKVLPGAQRRLRKLRPVAISDDDLERLGRCVELAREALDDGDEPFGSILVGADGATLYEDRNRVKDGDQTRHPEFAIAHWAVENLAPEERARATVYTSGEHCPMCAAAHAWVGLGRIVYATSSEQLIQWRAEWGSAPSPVAALPINTVAPHVIADGPAPQFADPMKALYEAKFRV
jgi:tRNA(Arg) A34 adenosine deaminase TadA